MQANEKGGLALTRGEGQSIQIDGPSTVVVDWARGGRTQLRILADREVIVLRGEIVERQAAEKARTP